MTHKISAKKHKNKLLRLITIYYSLTILACTTIITLVILSAFYAKPKTQKSNNPYLINFYSSYLTQSFPIIGITNKSQQDNSIANYFFNLSHSIFYLFIHEPISVFIQNTTKQSHEENIENLEINSFIDTENEFFIEDSSSIEMANADSDVEGHTNSDVVSNGDIIISNETNYKVNIPELQKEPLNLNFSKKNNKILIYHTHTTESFIPDLTKLDTSFYTRSRDPKNNIVKVGKSLSDNLSQKLGIQVTHNTTIHDYPNYNYSYGNALKTLNKTLKIDSKVKMVIDIHRDANSGKSKLRKVATINGKNAAKIMFVVSTGELEKNHPNWKENLKLALKLQEKLLKICPELTDKIVISKYRYNQHVSKGALLVEIGGDGNLIEECVESTQYLSKAINEVISGFSN